MDVFGPRERVFDSFFRCVRGFLAVKDPETKTFAEGFFDAGRHWPEPLVRLNRAFEPDATVDYSVSEGVLHQERARVFGRDMVESSPGTPLILHRHHEGTICVARTGSFYVLTTGTDPSKSLTYIIPQVAHVHHPYRRPRA